MKRRLRIQIAPDGTVTAKTLGFFGADCLDAIPVLEQILEATAVSSEFTDEYHAATTTATTETEIHTENDDELPTQS
ncbi:DUF2997 domain-containing protein [Gordonia crocea]|uniref:DUF2997 domain-containing protein n=1 Tax=Gordonia crocea TaxID=589162 RepID=A0A7I9UYL8_9ACTN|nr:DUF2997 domain-containing protein [Gordonia crocea]GED98022.1 hypothetical protein nbrc107697_20610 [Gordonia crocea]